MIDTQLRPFSVKRFEVTTREIKLFQNPRDRRLHMTKDVKELLPYI